MFLNTEDLLSSIKLRSFAPIAQNAFSDSDLLLLCNEELQMSLVPEIMKIREDFFLDSETVSLQASLNHYSIPERAIGNALKDVFFVDSSGNKYPLPRADVHLAQADQSLSGDPQRFYFKGDEIVVEPTPGSGVSGSLELFYFSRPNKLVATADCTKISSIASASGTTTFTVDTDLTASLSVGDKIDILSAKSPFKLWAQDVVITSISSTEIAVATTSVSDEASNVMPQANDYICVAQTANIPQIPQEFHPVLSQMVVVKLLQGLGDIQKLQMANSELDKMRLNVRNMISNRAEAAVQTIRVRNGLLGPKRSWW